MTTLLANWKPVLTAAIIAALALMLAIAKSDARHWRKMHAGEQAAHDQTVANYRAAADKARADAANNALRVRQEQAAITERIEDAYQDRLADADARYERLRATSAAYSGDPGAVQLPEDRNATCLAYAGTPCEGLPPLLREAQRNTDQLIALQGWVRSQFAVDFEPEE